jgi:hypothetical protein
MKFQTKIAVFVLATFLTLVGVNYIANGIMTKSAITAHSPGTLVTFEVSHVRVLA